MKGAYATAYTFPGNAVAPLVLSSTTPDSLSITSGTFQTPSSSSTGYTVDFSASTVANTISITVSSGATLSYAGSNSNANSINATLNTANNVATTITNNGTISSGNGFMGIYIANSNPGHGTVTINNNSAINGTIYLNNLDTIALNFNGNASMSAGVAINSSVTATAYNINVGNSTACNFTTGGTWTLSGTTQIILTIFNGSTFNQNFSISGGSGKLTVNSGGTYNLNASYTAENTTTNNGTLNIAADMTLIVDGDFGSFITGASGNTRVTETVTIAMGPTAYTNSGTHTARMYDLDNIGNATITGNTSCTLTTFTLEYTGGYLTAGTYTLLTSNANTTVPTTINKPSSTLFLSFGTPTGFGGKVITTTLSRTPFDFYATTPYAQNIGIALEAAGNNDPSASMLSVLDGVSACTTASCVQNALLQLGPLTTAPLYAYMLEVEHVVIRNAKLRLAALRNPDVYMAGDYDDFIMGTRLRENYVWIRPYGAYANQQAVDDIVGYYATSGGIAFGLDRDLDERYSLGLGFSYTYSQVRDKINNNSITNVKSYQGMIYGSYNFTDTRYLDWLLSITGNQYNGARYMEINSFIATANSKYSSQNFTTKAIWGQNFAAFDFLQVTPEASVMYLFTKQYTYNETNGGGASLSVSRDNANTLQLGIGGKLAVPLAVCPSVIMPEIHAWYLYNVINGKQNSTFYFIEGATNVVTSQFTPPRSAFRYGAALTVAVFDSLQVKGAIDVQLQDRYNSYWVYLNLKYLL